MSIATNILGLTAAIGLAYTGLHYKEDLGQALNLTKAGYTDKCNQAIEEERKAFKQICYSRTFKNIANGSLDAILRARDRKLTEAGCELRCELWRCSGFGEKDPKYKNSEYGVLIDKVDDCY